MPLRRCAVGYDAGENMERILLILRVLLASLVINTAFSLSHAVAKDYWLIYVQDDETPNIAYEEYAWFTDDTLTLSKKKDELLKFFEVVPRATGGTRTGPGTVSSTAGSTIITGKLTDFKNRFKPGDIFIAAGQRLTVANVDSHNELTVTSPPDPVLKDATYIAPLAIIRPRNPLPPTKFGTGKPIVTKKDESHVLLMFAAPQAFRCMKTYEVITQVSPTPTHEAAPKIRAGQTPSPIGFICDLDSLHKGNTKITYTISDISLVDPTISTDRVKDEIRVRELYRFRIIAGPVYSSLISRNKSFQTITNAGGQTVITSSRNNDAPVNFPIFLKMYWKERDILDKIPWLDDFTSWCSWEKFLVYRLNPIVGINLVDHPFKNFYLGISFEFFSGLDLVAGAHFSKITQLQGGFAEGPVNAGTPNPPPTTEKFLTGGFVGLTVDVGVIASWIGNGIMSTVRGYKD
jgi:hypothetical protein